MTDTKPAVMALANGLMDKSKELQKEILMEKLRSKTSQNKNLAETAKAVRMALLDKRWAVDNVDRMILQKCLDSLQHCIKVSSLQSLIERLECLSRQLGLKFVVGSSGVNMFISSDMFYLEILVEASGAVKDVKIHHEGKMEQQSCEELVSCISRGDFADFTAQLEGLTAVYQLNAEKKVKCKAFSALQSLEEDLCTLRALHAGKEPWALVLRGPVGYLQRRRGGHAMRLTYFVSPYELLDKEVGVRPLTAELLGGPRAPGHSARVLLQGAPANKLQLAPTISAAPRAGKPSTGPVYASLVPQNSAMLPACFTLKLSEPMPLCSGLAKLIQATTEMEVAGDWAHAKPMLSLVAQHAYNKLTPGKTVELNLSKGLFVNLPDSSQCYFVCSSGSGGRGLAGCVAHSLPFTAPAHVAPLLHALRQQALFNTLVASCVRLQPRHAMDLESTQIFEVSALSWQHISISLEHPLEESMATVELSLADPAAPRAAVYAGAGAGGGGAGGAGGALDEHVTRVLRETHSIPVTLRALIMIWKREASAKQMNGGYSALDGANFSMGPTAHDPGPPRFPPAPHPHQGFLSDSQRHNMSMMSQDIGEMKPTDERKSKKRKSDDLWSSCQKKGKQAISEMMDSDSESENSDAFVNDDTMNSNSSAELGGRASSVSQAELASDLELSGMDATDALGGLDNRVTSDLENSVDGDVEELIRNSFHKSDHKRQKLKTKDESRSSKSGSSSLVLELPEGAPYVPSAVSITPVGAGGLGAGAGGLGAGLALDRRPGIEIIPLAAPPAALPSSITITPITSSQAKSMDDRIRSERRLSKSEDRTKDKKKKKRRDEMGPPEKVPPKQDPLTKPVSVSIKPTDGPPMRAASPNSLMRKFSPSPTHGRSVSITKSPTHSVKGKSSGTSSHQSSPRHSPVPNSPKHLSGYSSPKNHSISSPKHSSSGSGKPSMSALKSAASSSPSGKSGASGFDLSKSSKVPKDGYSAGSSSSREKDKKHSSLSFSSTDRSSPKLKNPMKMKQLEITPVPSDTVVPEPLISPQNMEVNKSVPSQVRNRKGSLSAVIDKLKSAQHVSTDSDLGSKAGNSSTANKFSDPKNGSSNIKTENKNPEYMVKPSSDGMKITINKTRTKESSSSSSKMSYSSSSSKQSSPQLTPPSQGSPKTHTGLKPGVISGPASKKTQAMQSSKSSSNPSGTPPKTSLSPSDTSSSNPTNPPKVPYSKSNASNTGMNLSKSTTKSSSGSPKSSSTDISKIVRDREREKARTKLMGGNSDKSLYSSKSERHSSPSGSRDEVDGDRFKSSSKESNFLVEGLIKPLDTSKFQIPKLKNQSTPDKGSPVGQYDNRSLVNDLSRTLDQAKYPFPHFHSPNPRSEDVQKSAYPLTVPKPLLNMGSMSPKTVQLKEQTSDIAKGESPRSKDDKDYTNTFPMMPLDFKTDMAKGFPAPKGSSEDRKGADVCMKPPASGAVARSGATTPQEAAEMLLDFSSSSGNKVSGMVAVRPVYPPSPALLMAKSPAPSPLVAPSPHSNSPCITDDELMDEALVGPGK